MIISDEQVRRAVQYLRMSERDCANGVREGSAEPVSDDLVQRATQAARSSPEIRDDRVERGREMLEGRRPSSSDVAAKIIGRIISDSVR